MRISLYNCQGCGDIISEHSDTWRCHDKTYCSQICINKQFNAPCLISSRTPVFVDAPMLVNPKHITNHVETIAIILTLFTAVIVQCVILKTVVL